MSSKDVGSCAYLPMWHDGDDDRVFETYWTTNRGTEAGE
jgi:hypothetical protein